MLGKAIVPLKPGMPEEKLERIAGYALGSGAGEIVLACILDPIPASIGGEARQSLMEEHNREASAFLKGMEQRLGAMRHHSRIEYGNAADAIVSIADEEKADLIIMLTGGHDSLEDLILGSVTENVLRRASMPVLVVK